jgi:hypothetical protein
MRWLRLGTICALVMAPALVAAGAAAEQGKDTNKPKAPLGATASSAPGGSADAKAAAKETPEQKKRRQDYTLATANKIRAISHKNKKQMTPEMKALVEKHWKVAMRILRVERIAQNNAKPAVAKRATDALAKEDARFFAKLEELNKNAPVATGAAPSAAPKPSATGSAK